jgi:hypothetical protein
MLEWTPFRAISEVAILQATVEPLAQLLLCWTGALLGIVCDAVLRG